MKPEYKVHPKYEIEAANLIKKFKIDPALINGLAEQLRNLTWGLSVKAMMIQSGSMEAFLANATERRNLKEWLNLNFDPNNMQLGDIKVQIILKKQNGKVRKHTTGDIDVEMAIFNELVRIHELPMEPPSTKRPSAVTQTLKSYRPLAIFLHDNGLSKNKAATIIEDLVSPFPFMKGVNRQQITSKLFN